MNISTIEQGEELLKKVSDAEWNWDANNPQHQLLAFLVNHASELLQMAREVEERRQRKIATVQPVYRENNIQTD